MSPADTVANGTKAAPRTSLLARRRRLLFFALLFVAFLFRLSFGLCSQFQDSDTKQIYLLGLKFYATGAWPYFGPDVVWGEVQIPGALQALLVGAPFHALPLAEAPYLLLNLISFASLCLFAWYCCRCLPGLPRWFVWAWLLTSPWTLNLSTVIYNPSYLLAGGILFFVGALEIYPFTRRGVVPARLANAMMGFSLFWVMQLHMSWVVLVPYALAALAFQFRRGARHGLGALAWFAAGAAPTASLLLPTYLKYGLSAGSGGTISTVRLNAENLTAFWGVLTRTLSFASFEVARFLGAHTPERLALLREEPWLAPFALFLFAVGVAQVAALLACWFLRRHEQTGWRAIKYLALLNVCLLYVSFLFSIKPPQSNHLYVTLPIPVLYAFYCWDRLLGMRRWRAFAKVVVACGIIFHAGIAAHNFSRISIYVDRRAAQSAIDSKDYRILGERRPGSLY
ncbi:MAG TPA: hypothetical protein VEX60_07210 [Pyrinomonadaceae bacterium]|nr:hypothetical protein [Pyrinomonadaceae bacterium]